MNRNKLKDIIEEILKKIAQKSQMSDKQLSLNVTLLNLQIDNMVDHELYELLALDMIGLTLSSIQKSKTKGE